MTVASALAGWLLRGNWFHKLVTCYKQYKMQLPRIRHQGLGLLDVAALQPCRRAGRAAVLETHAIPLILLPFSERSDSRDEGRLNPLTVGSVGARSEWAVGAFWHSGATGAC